MIKMIILYLYIYLLLSINSKMIKYFYFYKIIKLTVENKISDFLIIDDNKYQFFLFLIIK